MIMIRTLKNWFSLRNLLLVCCAAAVILLAVKSIGVYHKISWVQQADSYYEQQKWVLAESFYRRAANNHQLQYQEQHIAQRLNELAPISAWNSSVSNTASRLQAAADTNQFEVFAEVYQQWLDLAEQQKQADSRFLQEYKEITASYAIESTLQHGFFAFRQQFEQALQSNLEQRDYSDESSKWNLLAIPQAYWNAPSSASSAVNRTTASDDDHSINAATSTADSSQSADLQALFEHYDQIKLNRLAAAGNFTAFLDQAVATLQAYQQHNYEADWIPSLAESGASSVIAKDITAEQSARFVSHARSFIDTAQQLDLQGSSLLSRIDNHINSLQETAFSMTAQGNFQEAMDLYQTLQPLRDMSDSIARTKVAWAVADPLYLLQSSNSSVSYEHAAGGVNWNGITVYAVATDNQNRLFFGKMNEEGAVSVWSGQIGPTSAQIQQLTMDNQLSTAEQPIIVVESDSGTEGVIRYSLYAVTGNGLRELVSFAGTRYDVENDHSLIVHQPLGGTPGQVDVYTVNEEGTYTITGSRPDASDYLSVSSAAAASYPNQPIRFSAEIVSVDDKGALVRTDNSYLRLTGNVSFSTGTFTVYGTFDGAFETWNAGEVEASGINENADSDEAENSETEGNYGTRDPAFEPEYGLGDSVPDPSPAMNISIPIVQVDHLE